MIAPFAIEILLVVDIVGAEAAIASLFLCGKYVSSAFKTRLTLAKRTLLAAFRSAPGQDHFERKAFVLNAGLSVAAMAITGSLLVSVMLWMPSIALLAHHA